MPNIPSFYHIDPLSLKKQFLYGKCKEGDTYLYSGNSGYIIRVILNKDDLEGLPYALAELLALNNNEVFVRYIGLIGLFEENEDVYFIGNLKGSLKKEVLPYK